MIAITHAQTGLTLQLEAGQRLTIEQASGWLAGDELPGAFSYSIAFPLSPQNQKFLGYGYRPDAAVPVHEVPVRVVLDGMLYRACTLSYRITEGKGDGYLKIDSGEVYEQIKKLTLLEALPDVISLGPGAQTLDQRMNAIAQMSIGSFPLTFFPIRNELFLEADLDASEVPYVRQSYVNVWTKTGFQIDRAGTAGKRGYLVVPQFFLSWVLTRIFAQVGYRIVGDWIGSAGVQRLVVFNQTAMDQTLGLGQLLQGFVVTAGMHLPDMSVSDFLIDIRQRFGLIFTFNANSRTVSIRRFSDVIKNAKPQNLTPFQLDGYSIDAPNGAGFAVYDYLDEADELNKDPKTGALIKPAPLVIGKGQTQVQLKCGTTQLIYDISPLSPAAAGARWLVPTVRQPGNVLDPYYAKSDRYPQLDPGETVAKRKYSTGLKLLSFLGITQDSAGNNYPLATPDIRNGRQEVVGTESCSLTGPGGIWQTVLRNYYYFQDNTRKALVPAKLPVATAASLRLDDTVQFSLEGNVLTSFLPSKLQAQTPGGSGVLFSKVEVLTIPAGLELSPDPVSTSVWVELIQTTTEVDTALPNGGGTRLGQATKQEVRVWADRAKTRPALATGLLVSVRHKSTAVAVDKTTTYTESVVVYPVSGSYALLEAALLSYTDLSAGFTTTSLTIVCLLDPGNGYNII